MKGFAATFFAILVICAFAAGCESTGRNDGTSRFAWSAGHWPVIEQRELPAPETGSI